MECAPSYQCRILFEMRVDFTNEYIPFNFWLGTTNLLAFCDKLVMCGTPKNKRGKVSLFDSYLANQQQLNAEYDRAGLLETLD